MPEKEMTPEPPRGPSLSNLTSIRRHLAKLLRDFENKKDVEKITIDRFKALVYGHNVLASITKDSELDDLEARLTALEGKTNALR